jgi:hypothetical protein
MGVHVARVGREEAHIGFWRENLMEKDHLEYLGIDGRIILKFILGRWSVVCRDLHQITESWRAVAHAAMNLRIT